MSTKIAKTADGRSFPEAWLRWASEFEKLGYDYDYAIDVIQMKSSYGNALEYLEKNPKRSLFDSIRKKKNQKNQKQYPRLTELGLNIEEIRTMSPSKSSNGRTPEIKQEEEKKVPQKLSTPKKDLPAIPKSQMSYSEIASKPPQKNLPTVIKAGNGGNNVYSGNAAIVRPAVGAAAIIRPAAPSKPFVQPEVKRIEEVLINANTEEKKQLQMSGSVAIVRPAAQKPLPMETESVTEKQVIMETKDKKESKEARATENANIKSESSPKSAFVKHEHVILHSQSAETKESKVTQSQEKANVEIQKELPQIHANRNESNVKVTVVHQKSIEERPPTLETIPNVVQPIKLEVSPIQEAKRLVIAEKKIVEVQDRNSPNVDGKLNVIFKEEKDCQVREQPEIPKSEILRVPSPKNEKKIIIQISQEKPRKESPQTEAGVVLAVVPRLIIQEESAKKMTYAEAARSPLTKAQETRVVPSVVQNTVDVNSMPVFKVGDEVELKRSNGSWTYALVKSVDKKSITVEYTDKNSKFQKKLALHTDHLCVLGTHLQSRAISDELRRKEDMLKALNNMEEDEDEDEEEEEEEEEEVVVKKEPKRLRSPSISRSSVVRRDLLSSGRATPLYGKGSSVLVRCSDGHWYRGRVSDLGKEVALVEYKRGRHSYAKKLPLRSKNLRLE